MEIYTKKPQRNHFLLSQQKQNSQIDLPPCHLCLLFTHQAKLLKLSLHFLRAIPQLLPAPLLSCHQPSSSVSRWWIVPTTGLADRPFLSRRERPPPKRPPTCWCPLEAPGLSCASCPAQSGPWQGGASLWNHTSQLFTLGSRHPTPLPFLCSAPTPPHPTLCFTLNLNGSFLKKEKKKQKERARWAQGGNCTMGLFYWFGAQQQTLSHSWRQGWVSSHLGFWTWCI